MTECVSVIVIIIASLTLYLSCSLSNLKPFPKLPKHSVHPCNSIISAQIISRLYQNISNVHARNVKLMSLLCLRAHQQRSWWFRCHGNSNVFLMGLHCHSSVFHTVVSEQQELMGFQQWAAKFAFESFFTFSNGKWSSPVLMVDCKHVGTPLIFPFTSVAWGLIRTFHQCNFLLLSTMWFMALEQNEGDTQMMEIWVLDSDNQINL